MTDEISELELMTKRLEVEKLRAEVQTAQLSWWKRPGYLGGLTPVLLALVGVGTAWVTGYFDTQRTQLATEIAGLETERDALNEQIEDAQRAIDFGYLQAKLAAYDANYAIGHFDAFSDEARDLLDQARSLLARQGSALDSMARMATFANLEEVLDRQTEIGEISKEAVESVLARLGQIDASPWAKELETDPMLSQQGRLRAPDGRLFDIGSWSWVDG